MSISPAVQSSLPPALRTPSSEAFDKDAQSSVLDSKKAAASEPVNQRESSSEPLNPFANLPTPFLPEPPLRVPPEEDALLQGAGVETGSGTSDLTIDIANFDPEGGGFFNPIGDVVPQPVPVPLPDSNSNFPTDFVPRSPFNPDPRPFVPGPQTPFPFPGAVVPGPPVPAPPLGLPPEEEALLQGAGGSAGSATGQSADGLEGPLTLTGTLPLNIDADEPITNRGEPIDLSEPIAFEPGGVVPGADFFTDFLGQPSAGQEVIDNARIQASPQAAPDVTSEPVNVSGNSGFLNPEKITGSRDVDAPSASTGNSNLLFAISSSLKEILSQLMNFLKL